MLVDHFVTERLSVRSWRPVIENEGERQRLANCLVDLLTPRVLKNLPPTLQLDSDADISAWIDARNQESEVLLVGQRETGVLLGLLILALEPEPDELLTLHIGYLLGEAVWGKGVASELLNGLLSALQPEAPIRLVGGVGKDNPASARVLEKAGFVVDATRSAEDMDHYVRTVS